MFDPELNPGLNPGLTPRLTHGFNRSIGCAGASALSKRTTNEQQPLRATLTLACPDVLSDSVGCERSTTDNALFSAIIGVTELGCCRGQPETARAIAETISVGSNFGPGKRMVQEPVKLRKL